MANRSRTATLLLLVVLVPVVVALAAWSLPGTYHARPVPPGGVLVISIPSPILGLLFLSPLLLGFGAILYRRLTEPVAIPSKLALPVLLAVGLVLLILVSQFGSGGGGIGFLQGGGTTSGGGTTGGPGGNGSTGGGSNGSFASSTPVQLSVPPWLLPVLVAGVCAAVAALTLPGVLSGILDRRGERRLALSGPVRQQVAEALGAAATNLAHGADPRETIVLLYLQLLARIRPLAGDMASATAEEIRAEHLLPLGVPTAAAETLTRLFELARYSTHELDRPTVDRAQEAIRAAHAAVLRGAAAS